MSSPALMAAAIFFLTVFLRASASACRASRFSHSRAYCSAASASSRRKKRSASDTAGLFIVAGGPISRPHRLGTTTQSSRRFGRTAHCRPTTAPTATIAAAAQYSGGHWTRSAASSSHARNTSGRR